jgi:uncharacterized protein (TIGR02453 family)
MVALTEALAEHGPFHIFRPNRDVRFDKDKSPYKEHVAAYSESEAGAGYYVQLGAAGMFAGCGYYDMATDQLQRFRNAIVEAGTGDELVGLCAAAERSGVRLGAMRELKTAPRGYPKDHPRIELLRRKGLIVSQDWPLATWMHSDKVVARIRAAWESAAEIIEWLNTHVGPSTLPPDDAFGH